MLVFKKVILIEGIAEQSPFSILKSPRRELGKDEYDEVGW
jgi:hypothetical protein